MSFSFSDTIITLQLSFKVVFRLWHIQIDKVFFHFVFINQYSSIVHGGIGAFSILRYQRFMRDGGISAFLHNMGCGLVPSCVIISWNNLIKLYFGNFYENYTLIHLMKLYVFQIDGKCAFEPQALRGLSY